MFSFATTPQSFPIAFTNRPSTPVRWCGAYPPHLIEDGSVVGYDDPEDTLWKQFFPTGMRVEQMMYIYWKMRDFKITYPSASLESHEESTGDCPGPGEGEMHPVTQDLHSDESFEAGTVLSTDDPGGRNGYYRFGEFAEFDPPPPAPEHAGILACMYKRHLSVTKEGVGTSEFDLFNCPTKTTNEVTLDLSVKLRLFDSYGPPPWMYSADTGLYYPSVSLEIGTGNLFFSCGRGSILEPGDSIPGAAAVAGTFTIKGKPGSQFFEEDVVFPAVVAGFGYEEVTSVSSMDVTMEILSEWP